MTEAEYKNWRKQNPTKPVFKMDDEVIRYLFGKK